MASLPPSSSPRPVHLAALVIFFFLSAAFLLQPLFLPPSPTDQAADPYFSGFAERAALNQVARVALGAAALTEQAPAAGRMLGPLRESVQEGEKESDKLDVRLMRLALYEALEMNEAAGTVRERIKSQLPHSSPDGEDPNARKSREALGALVRIYIDRQPVEEATMQSVVDAFGFVGKLARVRNQELKPGDGDVTGLQPLQEEAFRYLIGFIGIVACVLLLFGAGLLLLIVAFIRYQDGKLVSRFRQTATPPWLNLETFTVFLALMIFGSLLSDRFPRPDRFPLLPSLMLQLVLMTIVFYPRLYRFSWRTVRQDLGLTSGAGAIREVSLGPIGYVAALPLVAVGVMLTLLIVRVTGLDPGQGMHPIVPLIKGENASPLTAAMALLLAVVLAPLAEEITFRGFFYNALRSRFSAALSIALSSAFFAGIHPQGIIGFPMLMAIGVMLAALREWRGSLIAPIVAHACTNGVTMLIVLLGY